MNDTNGSRHKTPSESILTLPLKWLAIELVRLRGSAGLLAEVAVADAFDYGKISEVIQLLRKDMPQQFADEAIDILPLLQLRAQRGDDLDGIVTRLNNGHHVMAAMTRHILPRLEALCLAEQPVRAAPEIAKYLGELAAMYSSHLAIVGAVILPIARLRLRPADLKALGHDLTARRKHQDQ